MTSEDGKVSFHTPRPPIDDDDHDDVVKMRTDGHATGDLRQACKKHVLLIANDPSFARWLFESGATPKNRERAFPVSSFLISTPTSHSSLVHLTISSVAVAPSSLPTAPASVPLLPWYRNCGTIKLKKKIHANTIRKRPDSSVVEFLLWEIIRSFKL